MTKQLNKINALYLSKYSMEQSKIYFKNSNSISFLKYLNINSIPMDIQESILSGNYAKTLKLLRKYNKVKSNKKVKIHYSCDVYSTVTKSWHVVDNELLCYGSYNNISEIKKAIEHKREANKESMLKGYIKNLTFKYTFEI